MPAREATIRDYRERVNRVIFHIERHLDEELGLEELARVACFSPCHFHRIFGAIAGEPLADFVRRLRLERAALSLLHLDAAVTEIALGAGYETPSAFGRAFAARFGVSPSEYRRRNEPARLLGARPLDLSQTQEETTMEPEIRTTDPIPVIFARRTGPYAEAAAAAFGAVCGFAGPRGLFGPATRMIGISHDDPHVTAGAKLRYDACVTVDREVKTEGEIGAKTIPGGRHAVFLHSGPYAGLQATYDAIFGKWLPASGEQLREEPCFEVYLTDPARCPPEAMRTEIWLPLR
jgi:AraC family transcriptional regulator